MNIVLDTNIVFNNWYLSSPHFYILEKYLNVSESKLFVPEIVVLESKNLFKREFTKLIKDIARLRRLLPEGDGLQELPDIDEKCLVYNTKLDERLAELNAERPGHSDIPHDAIVARALVPHKPFREKDRGYRDTLLWETILRKIVTNETTTFLISDNYKDFANIPTDRMLHADLIKDLISGGLPEASVQFYSNLKSFIDEQVKPELEVVTDDIVRRLKDSSYEGFSFGKWFVENRDAIIEKVSENIRSAFGHVYSELEDPTIDYIEDPEEMEIVEVARYIGDEEIYHIEVCATSDMAVDVFVDKAAYYSHLCEEVPLDVWDYDWNKWYIWAKIEELRLPVSFLLVFNASSKIVEDFEVDRVGEVWGWCRFCRAQIMSETAEECWSCGKSFG
jgi:hypothetical protein